MAVFRGGKSPLAGLEEAIKGLPDQGAGTKSLLALAQAQAALRKFKAKPERTLLLTQEDCQWVFVGLGDPEQLTRSLFCDAVGSGVEALMTTGADNLSLFLPHHLPWNLEPSAQYAMEALALAAYTFPLYRTKALHPGLAQAELIPLGRKSPARDLKALRQGLEKAKQIIAGVFLARDLINHPANTAHTDFMVEQARTTAKEVKARMKVVQGDALQKQGYGAIHAVGRSGPRPPALVALESGKPAKGKPTLALVGKGVVFDSGGLDLKPSSAMALMKKDMGGAGIVLGAFRAIAGLGLPIHLVAVLGLAENMVGPDAFHPGDVLTSKLGKTIEITNTDAEGRLVLADAFAMAHTYKPTHMVDFATLTGAARVALGKEIMALFCDDSHLREQIQACGEHTGEAVWPLPMWAGYRKKMDSTIADLVNSSPDGMAGAITAALFLKEFAGNQPWAHLDCYGWSDGDQPLFPKGGSGSGVRLMVELVERLLEK